VTRVIDEGCVSKSRLASERPRLATHAEEPLLGRAHDVSSGNPSESIRNLDEAPCDQVLHECTPIPLPCIQVDASHARSKARHSALHLRPTAIHGTLLELLVNFALKINCESVIM